MSQADSTINTSRRNLLTSGAIAIAGAAIMVSPAISAPRALADPIFAAIEDHKKAYTAFDACVSRQSSLEESIPQHLRQSSIDYHDNKIVETDDPRWIASEQDWQARSQAEEDAAMALVNIEPTTLAGAAHLMRHVAEHEAKGNAWPDGLVEENAPPTAAGKPWSYYLHKNIAALLETFEHAA